MKILLTTDLYKPLINGVITSVDTLRNELIKKGHDVRILTLSSLSLSLEKEGIYYVSSLNANKIYPGARFALHTNTLIKEDIIDWGPDLIHSQCEFSTFKIAKEISRELKIPIVHTYHTIYEDYTHYFFPSKRSGRQLVKVLSRIILNQADVVISPTQKVYDLLHDYGVKQPLFIIPTGIDIAKFQDKISLEEKSVLKAQLGLNPDKLSLIFVGRLAKEKNLTEILNYLAKMKDLPVQLLVIGDGPYRQTLEAEAQKLQISDSCYFIGKKPSDEIPGYYQLGDVFVSASSSETQGLTYLEALSAGLPAVCRKDMALDGVIIDYFNGVQYENFDQFRQAITYLVDRPDQLALVGERARHHAYSHFSASSFADKVLHAYQVALENQQEKK